jgi:DNA-binding ferritin-like protein (Dps family)
MNPKSLRKATREMKKMARKERKMKKKYQKYADARAEYLNAKNSTNYELNKIAYLNQINEVLEN